MSFLKHVMTVGEWRCDLRDSGAYLGQRVATKLGAGNEIEVQLEWYERDEAGEPLPDGEQFLVTDIKKGWSRVCAAPQRVLEWLMTGTGAQDEAEEHVQEPDWLEVLHSPGLR